MRMSVKSIYGYLFYRLYTWGSRYLGESDIPEFYGFLWLTLLIYVNLLTIIIFTGRLLGLMMPFASGVAGKIEIVSILAVLGLINYCLFIRGKKYKVILAKYETESDFDRRRGNSLCLAYVVASLMALSLLFII